MTMSNSRGDIKSVQLSAVASTKRQVSSTDTSHHPSTYHCPILPSDADCFCIAAAALTQWDELDVPFAFIGMRPRLFETSGRLGRRLGTVGGRTAGGVVLLVGGVLIALCRTA